MCKINVFSPFSDLLVQLSSQENMLQRNYKRHQTYSVKVCNNGIMDHRRPPESDKVNLTKSLILFLFRPTDAGNRFIRLYIFVE